MKRNWLTRTLIVLLTLAMVAGVMAIKPTAAKAEEDNGPTGGSISPSTWSVPLNVGDAQEFVVSGVTGKPDATTGEIKLEYAWSVSGDAVTLEDGSRGDVSKRAIVAKVGTATVTCTVKDKNDADKTANYAAHITVTAFGIATAESGMTVEETRTLEFKNVPSGVSPTCSRADSSILTVSGNTITAVGQGNGEIIVDCGVQRASYKVSVGLKQGSLALSGGTETVSPGQVIDMNQYLSKTYDKDVSWSVSGGAATISSTGSLNVGSSTGTITVTASVSGSTKYTTPSPATKSFTVASAATFTLSSTSLTISPYNSYANITVTSTPSGGTISASSLDTSLATVSGGGGSGSATFTVQGVKTGNTYIRFRNSMGTGYVDVPVRVGNPTPTITAWFDPDTYTMNKSTGYITLHIHVENPQTNYVTIKRSNIRTYATGYDTHQSTYYYTHYLDSDNDARFYIHPQYNGTTYYTISATGASNIQTHNLTVSGYTTMPQTGPDYTWVYILSGLCVAALAAAVTLNVRKKKQQEN